MVPARTVVMFAFGLVVLTVVAILVIGEQWTPVYDEPGNGCKELTDASRDQRDAAGAPFQWLLGGWTVAFAALFCGLSAREFPARGVRAVFVGGCVPGAFGFVLIPVTVLGPSSGLDVVLAIGFGALMLLLSGALAAGAALLSSPDARPGDAFWSWCRAWALAATLLLISNAVLAGFVSADEVPIC